MHDRDELEQLTEKIQQLNSTIKQQEKKLHKAGTCIYIILNVNYNMKTNLLNAIRTSCDVTLNILFVVQLNKRRKHVLL